MENIVDFSGIAALILALLAIVKAWKEKPAQDADIVTKYESIASSAAERALKLEARITKLEDERDTLKTQINDLENQITALAEENETLKGSVSRLVFQVKSLGATPVTHKATRNKKE